MDAVLLQRLAQITEEERELLQGRGVDRALYASGRAFEVDAAKMLEKGKLMSIRPHTRFAPFPRHSHNYVEIMYMCRGKTVHRIDGDALVTLEAGELLFLNRHASHAIQRADAGDIAVNFIVLPQFFDEAFNMAGMDNVLSRFLLGELYTGGAAVSYLHFRVREVLPVQNLVENMVWTLVNRQPGARRINQVTMGLLLLQLMHYTECIDMSRNGSIRSPMVEAALREIEENYRAASLTDVAAAFHVGLPYLSAEVKRATGSTFKELLLHKRLDKAPRLLRETRLTIQEVCAAVGYDNTSYFHRVFRRRYGKSPKEYRSELWKTENAT